MTDAGPASRRPYWNRRLQRHALLALSSTTATLLLIPIANDKASPSFRISMATGYVSLTLLTLTLAVGPRLVLIGRRAPTSSDLRRDLGIWGAILAFAHVISGLEVHMQSAVWKYFLDPRRGPHTILPRLDGFGLANLAGLAATVVLALLLALSNDMALRRLGASRWKALQRFSYVAMALTALHGAAYQYIDQRSAPFVGVLLVMLGGVLAIQIAGALEWRRRGGPRVS